jgi:hypothetical protein
MSNPRDPSSPLPAEYVLGVMDACAGFHPDYPRPRVTFSVKDPWIRSRMRERWGGFILGRRLIIESPEQLGTLLRHWLPVTRIHAGDIARMLSALEHRPIDPDGLAV